MTSPHEVISAFLDDEPFEPNELAAALADPGGRDLLIDLVALRDIVQPAHAHMSVAARQPILRGPVGWSVAAAAAVLIAAGGFAIGRGASAARQNAASVAPAPTRVIDVNWNDNKGGR